MIFRQARNRTTRKKLSFTQQALGLGCLVLILGCSEPAPDGLRPATSKLGKKVPGNADLNGEWQISFSLDQETEAPSPPSATSESTPVPPPQESLPLSNDKPTQTPDGDKPKARSLFHRNRQYTEGQLHKNNTTLLLVHEGDIRADYLLKKYLPFLEKDQVQGAKKMVWSYDDRFVRLRRQRASILEHASDEQDVDQMLFENKLDIADLVTEIREKIYRDVMTPDQLRTAQESFRIENELQKKTLNR